MDTWKELFWLVRPFKKEFALTIFWTLVYEVYSLFQSTAMGVLLFVFDAKLGLMWFVAYTLFYGLYEEVYVRFDNFMDKQIANLLHNFYWHLKTASMATYASLDASWHSKANSGEVHGELGSSTDKAFSLFEGILWEFGPTALQTILCLMVLLVVSPLAFALCFVALGLYAFLTVRQEQEQYPLRKQRHGLYEDSWRLGEWFKAHQTVSAFAQESALMQRFEGLQSTIRSLSRGLDEIAIFKYGRRKMQILGWTKRLVIFVLAYQVLNLGMELSVLLVVSEYVSRLTSSAHRLVRTFTRILEHRVSIHKLYEFMNQKPLITSPQNPITAPTRPIGIEFNCVSMRYGEAGELALSCLGFEIKPGEVVGVVGRSGGGKTTVTKLMLRYMDPTEGEVLINGRSAREYALADLRRSFAIVSQAVEVFDTTLLENITFGNAVSDDVVLEAVKRSGLAPFVESLEFGVMTVVGERGVRLSGGQLQRLAIARALVAMESGAGVLVLDEATSNQDALMTREIQQNLLPVMRDTNRTVVVIAHNLDTLLGVVDRILVLDKGKLVESGTHEELLACNGAYRQLWNAHRKGAEDRV